MKHIIKSEIKKDETISKQQARLNISQWLYVNDGNYKSKTDWRVGLIEMLDWNIKRIK